RALPVAAQVVLHALLGVLHDGSRGHREDEVLPGRAVTLCPASMAATLRRVMAPSAKRREIPQVRIRDQHDVAAAPAVAPIRPSARHVGLAAEAHAAVPAASGLHLDRYPVIEHDFVPGRRPWALYLRCMPFPGNTAPCAPAG